MQMMKIQSFSSWKLQKLGLHVNPIALWPNQINVQKLHHCVDCIDSGYLPDISFDLLQA